MTAVLIQKVYLTQVAANATASITITSPNNSLVVCLTTFSDQATTIGSVGIASTANPNWYGLSEVHQFTYDAPSTLTFGTAIVVIQGIASGAQTINIAIPYTSIVGVEGTISEFSGIAGLQSDGFGFNYGDETSATSASTSDYTTTVNNDLLLSAISVYATSNTTAIGLPDPAPGYGGSLGVNQNSSPGIVAFQYSYANAAVTGTYGGVWTWSTPSYIWTAVAMATPYYIKPIRNVFQRTILFTSVC